MNDLREKIIEQVALVSSLSSRAHERCADRILSLLLKDEAEAKLPEGMEIVLCPIGGWDVRTATHNLGRMTNVWGTRTHELDRIGLFDTRAAALAAALKAPPVPTETKSRDGCKPSPAVTHADMRRLADLGEQQGWPVLPKLLREIFKEPA